MSLIVLKFGGTSIGSCDKIIKVAKLIKKYHNQKNKVIVVSSAMSGNTDDLIKKVELSKTNEIVVLKAAEAMGTTPDTKIGFIIINPIA